VTKLDPRVNAYRDGLAAIGLKGVVDAPRYAEGRSAVVVRGIANLRNAPREDSGLDTQLVYGETFTVYDEADGWAWGQAARDHYVGYVRAERLLFGEAHPSHRVRVLGSPLLSAPNSKSPARDLLPMNAKVTIVSEENGFAKIADGDYLYAAHLTPLGQAQSDWVGMAEKFFGSPYLWGGKTSAGCDCSGVLQTALEAGGIWSPRDTDMMEEALGQALPVSEDLSGLKRGDLVFWKAHIGVMLDETRLLHANAYHMLVAIEPLRDAAERIARKEGAIRSIKRL
jgi:cell wall-associated NlpC family hydrolase